MYLEITLTISPIDPFRDLLVYALGDEGPYESFVETPDGLKAYVDADHYDEDFLLQAIADNCHGCTVSHTLCQMPDKDWNEEWERGHQWVLVDDLCYIRAPFHPALAEQPFQARHEIVIEPKMSFGTAHHPTTYLMLQQLCQMPIAGLRVLDMGCGTAVLAILAAMRGAAYVEGIDIDIWAYRNALENADTNNVAINCRLGDAALLSPSNEPFDLIIANINRNILLRDMPAYAAVLKSGGHILFSGFYEHDTPLLQQKAATIGLSLASARSRDGWQMLEMVKD